VDEDCCEVDTVSVNPPWVWPKNTGGNTEADVFVSLLRPSPPGGCTVDLSIEPVSGSGGHSHDGRRPTGTLSDKTWTFYSTDMEKSITYASGEVSGTEKIRVVVEESGDSEEAQVEIKVPGLAPFPQSGEHHVVVRRGADTHPDGAYGMPITIEILKEVAQEYFELTKRKLSINDLSLPEGGLFDIGDIKWATPHIEHRAGNDADINRTDGGGVFKNCEGDKALREAVRYVGSGGIPWLKCESGGRKHINFD